MSGARPSVPPQERRRVTVGDIAESAPTRLASGRTVLRSLVAVCSLAGKAAPGTLLAYATLTLTTGTLPVVIAWLTKLLLDDLVHDKPSRTLVTLGAGIAAAGLAGMLAPQLRRYLQEQLDRATGLLAHDRLFTALEGFVGLGRFENPRFLDQLRLADQAGRTTSSLALDGLLGMATIAITITGFLGSLFLVSPVLTVLVLASGIPVLTAETALSRRRSRMLWGIGPVERREVFYSELLSSAQAAKEVRIFGIGAFFRARMLGERKTANAARRTMDRREFRTGATLGMLTAVVSGGGLLWALGATRDHRLSVGGITMFVAAVAGVQGGLGMLATQLGRAHQGLSLFSHYLAVTTAGADLPLAAPPRPLPALRNGIELRDVWFRYSDEHPWVLRGVDLWIPHGMAVGLVGLNGAGKSTLVKLLCRFYDPTRGTIRWDGVDLRDVDVTELRRRIGVVFQDYLHYDMTAAENIGLGDLAMLHDRTTIQAAARRAGIHQKLAGLPQGYDTLLSRRFSTPHGDDDPASGVHLSGGELQRLALARAFLRDQRDLMILDEPSAGLDAESEHEIHTSLTRHRAGRTSLLISHRLGTIRDADTIIVLSGGEVLEQGSHTTLLAAGGQYARLFTLQAARYQTEAEGVATPAGKQ